MSRGRLEAIRESEVAEQMMSSNDFASAREHLLQAYQLFPALDNIGSMLTVCDILTAARVELPGCGIDHYWVLQVIPSSTLDDIKCQYQKLVTLLQPISTKFSCTKLALKLLQDAFIVLRDHKMRSEFDLKRLTSWENYRSFDLQASIRQISLNTSLSSSAYKDSSSQICDGGSKPAEMLSKDFATCEANQVNLQDMYKQQFEVNIGEINWSSVNLVNLPTALQHPSLEANLCSSEAATLKKRPFQDFYIFDSDRKFQHFVAGQVWAANYRADLSHNYQYARIDSTSKAAICVTWLKPIPLTSSERRWCDASMPVACGSFEVSSEMQMHIEVRWPEIASYKCSCTHGVTEEQFEIYPKRGEIWAVYKDWDLDDWSYNPDSVKGCKFELIEIISDFSKYLGAYGACLAKVDGLRCIFERQTIGGNPVTFHIPPNNLYIFSHKILAYRFKGGELDKVAEGMYELDQLALPDYLIQDACTQKAQDNLTFQGQLHSFKSPLENKILMPSWSQKNFIAGQVWAMYWGEDYMPRKYVRINNVISENQVFVTFLEPLPVMEHEIECIRQDLPIVCGIFKVGERSANIEKSLFCYLVRCKEITSKSCYKIYPLKGEIWATYKGWNANWKMVDYKSYRCQIVRIVSDFSEGDGITISRLGEVKGCLTFFHVQQYDGFDLIHEVSRADILKFSHQIPAFKVPGISKYGIPESSWHLEPLALPGRVENSSGIFYS